LFVAVREVMNWKISNATLIIDGKAIKAFPRPSGGDNRVTAIIVWKNDGSNWAGRL
jgi:hypothetical protein